MPGAEEWPRQPADLGFDWAGELSDWALEAVINAASKEAVIRAATRRASLGEQVDSQLTGALESRAVIAQATGVLAERLTLAPDAAFAHLVGLARASHLTVSQVALQMVGGSTRTGLTQQMAVAAMKPEGTADRPDVPGRVIATVPTQTGLRVRVAALVDAADARDQAASVRDRAGRRRDRAATYRDTVAVQREASAEVWVEAEGAQADRREALADRRDADLDRTWAARDRDESAADRGLLVDVTTAANRLSDLGAP